MSLHNLGASFRERDSFITLNYGTFSYLFKKHPVDYKLLLYPHFFRYFVIGFIWCFFLLSLIKLPRQGIFTIQIELLFFKCQDKILITTMQENPVSACLLKCDAHLTHNAIELDWSAERLSKKYIFWNWNNKYKSPWMLHRINVQIWGKTQETNNRYWLLM